LRLIVLVSAPLIGWMGWLPMWLPQSFGANNQRMFPLWMVGFPEMDAPGSTCGNVDSEADA
jgi:hypothetical protein